MTAFILRRLLAVPFIVLAVYTVTFTLLWVVPGNPLENPEGRRPSPEIVAAMQKQYKLDDPVAFCIDGSGKTYDVIVLGSGISGTLAAVILAKKGYRVLIIDGASVDANFALAARNLQGVDVLPTIGANVYDILKRDTLVITKAGIEALEARLK